MDTGSGTAPTAPVSTVSGLQPGTTYHYRLVASNIAGTTDGYDYTAQTTTSPPVNSQPPAITGTAQQGQGR